MDGTPTNAFTLSLANCAGEPGVENMLGHAPPSLAASGLDMRGGHPARSGAFGKAHQVEVLTPRRPCAALSKLTQVSDNFKQRTNCPCSFGEIPPRSLG